MKFFETCFSVEAIKTLYRELAKKFHPDHGGDTRTMQDINAAYHDALKRCDGKTSRDSDGNEHTYRYDFQVEQDVIEKIYELLGMRLTGVEIALIGRWIWITGDTRPVKEELKKAKCKYHAKRQCWYWHNQGYYSKYSGKSLGELASHYGYANKFDKREQVD